LTGYLASRQFGLLYSDKCLVVYVFLNILTACNRQTTRTVCEVYKPDESRL